MFNHLHIIIHMNICICIIILHLAGKGSQIKAHTITDIFGKDQLFYHNLTECSIHTSCCANHGCSASTLCQRHG